MSEEWVSEAARLFGVTCRKAPKRKTWEVVIAGSGVYRILKEIRPFLFWLESQSN